jgi:type IV pilus assembly protein PilO
VANVIPQDKRGQIQLMLTVVAAVAIYVLWQGLSFAGIDGVKQFKARRDSIQTQIDTLESEVRRAKADVQHGTVGLLETRTAQFRASLELMRQLVPASTEVPNLLDDISSRAKMRGATVADFTPQGLESGATFDVQRARFTVMGQFDQIGEFISDIASLPRIVVPFDVKIDRATGPTIDTTSHRALLRLAFQIRTFVKSGAPSGEAGGAAPAAAPAAPAAGATPRTGAAHD